MCKRKEEEIERGKFSERNVCKLEWKKKVKALQVFENFLKFGLNLENHEYFNNFIKYFLKFATP